MDDIGKASLAVTHALIAASIAATFPPGLATVFAAFVAYMLVFY